jgi:hypothetical protein
MNGDQRGRRAPYGALGNHMCVDDEDGADTHDEPSLGFLEITNQERSAQGGTDQWFIDRELDTADDEPSLGSRDHYHTVAILRKTSPSPASPTLKVCTNRSERRPGPKGVWANAAIRLLIALYRLRLTRWRWQAKRFLTSRE